MGQGPGAASWQVGDYNGDGKPEILQCWANGTDLGLIQYGDNGKGGMAVLWSTGDVEEGPGAVFWLTGRLFAAPSEDFLVQGWANGSTLGMITYCKATE
jgi:hypothetical protein